MRRDIRALPENLSRVQAGGLFQIVRPASGTTPAPAAPRSCGDCRLCCKLLAVQEIEKPRGEWCKHACSNGCGVYETRPQQCRDFACLWLLAAHESAHPTLAQIFPLDERPDRTRVVFTPFLGGVRHPESGEMLRAVCLQEDKSGHVRAADVIQRFLERGIAVLHNNAERCLGCWYPDGYWAMSADHPDAKLFDRTKASPEEVARVDRLEEEARQEIAENEARRAPRAVEGGEAPRDRPGSQDGEAPR